jgi:hypothetical protein
MAPKVHRDRKARNQSYPGYGSIARIIGLSSMDPGDPSHKWKRKISDGKARLILDVRD